MSVQFGSVVVCEDIRLERSGKHILIGVFSGDILVSGFPAGVALAFYIPIVPKESGDFAWKMRVVDENGTVAATTIIRAKNVTKGKNSVLAFPPVGIPLDSPTDIRLQVQTEDGRKWKTIRSINIDVAAPDRRESLGLAPPPVMPQDG